MAKNIDFMGAIFPDVPSVKLPQQGGGLVSFDDTTDATATADKILQGYTAYANGEKLVGTASGGSAVIEPLSVTQNGVYSAPSGVDGYSPVTVNVSGGGGGLTLIGTQSLGEINPPGTSAQDTGQVLTINGCDVYDLLIVSITADTVKSGYHINTTSFVLLTRESYTADYSAEAKTNAFMITHKIQYMTKDDNLKARASTTGYGVYPNSITLSNGTITAPIYTRYNSNFTTYLHDTYTAKVYGVKLVDLFHL